MPVEPYSQDLLTRAINVNWGGGLAVEFVSKSYLNYGKDVPLSKAVISLWFRAASSALDQALRNGIRSATIRIPTRCCPGLFR